MFQSQQNEKFLWFDTDHIKDLDKLTDAQISYLNRISFNIFAPLNLLLSRHWDMLLVWVLYRIALALFDSTDEADISLYFACASVMLYGIYALFGFFQGRRLDWNRSNYSSFEAFQKSSGRWNIFGFISLIFGISYLLVMA